MGFIRGGIVFFLGVLLFISLLTFNSLFILSSSLKYDNVKDSLYPVVQQLTIGDGGELIPRDVLGDLNLTKAAQEHTDEVRDYCVNNTEYKFDYNEISINISCASIDLDNPESIIKETFNDVVYDTYYKKYDCKFFDCFQKTGTPLFLVSEQARDYWQSKFYVSIIIALILILLIFLAAEEKRNVPLIVGLILSLSALCLLKLGDLLYLVAGEFSTMVKIFLSSTQNVFLFSLIMGIILIITGIVLKILNRKNKDNQIKVKQGKN